MIIDDKLVMADSEDTIKSIGCGSNAIIGDVLDLGAAGKNAWGDSLANLIDAAGNIHANIKCTTDFASAGSPAVTITVETANDASISSGAVILASVVTDKTPNAGDTLLQQSMPGASVTAIMKRYLGVRVTLATATLTAAKIHAHLGPPMDTPLSPTNLKD